jgi:hypothetical protein
VNVKRVNTARNTDTNIIPMPTPKPRKASIDAEAVHYPDLTDELFGEDD